MGALYVNFIITAAHDGRPSTLEGHMDTFAREFDDLDIILWELSQPDDYKEIWRRHYEGEPLSQPSDAFASDKLPAPLEDTEAWERIFQANIQNGSAPSREDVGATPEALLPLRQARGAEAVGVMHSLIRPLAGRLDDARRRFRETFA